MRIQSDTTVTGTPDQFKKQGQNADNNITGAGKVAREFEALMVNEMMKSMRATTGKDGLLSGGRGEEIYRSLLDQEYAQAIAAGNTLGLQRMIEQQLAGADKPSAHRPPTGRRD